MDISSILFITITIEKYFVYLYFEMNTPNFTSDEKELSLYPHHSCLLLFDVIIGVLRT